MTYCSVLGINPEPQCLFSRLLKDPVFIQTETLEYQAIIKNMTLRRNVCQLRLI